ncbi:hypothetical protein C4J81_11825 [Deltaproteobacteria bacterium Smac51]|nr:hypothetical protein C4J81_11825 [Deltaproteobacteria bacterium Smac51]
MKTLEVTDGLMRWRLLLGEAAEASCGGLTGDAAAADAALNWLYGRDEQWGRRDERPAGDKGAGLGPSRLSTPAWINEIHRLFPQEVIERLEKDAVEVYGIDEVVTSLEVLEKIEPSVTLLKAVLQTKHLMNPEVLAAARRLVREVVRRIMEKMRTEVRQSFSGTRDRRHRSRFKLNRNFDFKETIKSNLHRWEPAKLKLYLETPVFNSRSRKFSEKWDIIILVDQSGSMVNSVIHSAVMAACLWDIPGMKTRLIAFDTQVVDLTTEADDPVELLMKVQLGGGTDIAKAVAYAQGLIENPARSVVVLITDFCEGGDDGELVRRAKALTESGVHLLGLAALDERARPDYDRDMAARLVKVGAQVGAMTPGELASWLAQKIQGNK